MLFSVSYAGLWGQYKLSLLEFIKKASEIGYPSIEIMAKKPHLSVLDAKDDFLCEVKEVAKKYNVDIGTIAAYTDFTNGQSAREVPFIEMQVFYIRELARIAHLLGAKLIRVFTGYITDPESYRKDWDICVNAIRQCADAALEYGVTIGVQNHHDVAVGFESYIEFLNEIDRPNVKAMFDPWSIALHGEDMRMCARKMAPAMAQTTIADYIKLKRFAYMPGLINYRSLPEMVMAVPAGDGFVDLKSFFTGLKEGGFKGYVAYEMCSPLRGGGEEKNLDATATKSLTMIKQLIG